MIDEILKLTLFFPDRTEQGIAAIEDSYNTNLFKTTSFCKIMSCGYNKSGKTLKVYNKGVIELIDKVEVICFPSC